MRTAIALLSGLVFGFGLIISGMANPAEVQNFLDPFGTWDPSLAFVMLGAILVTMVGYSFARQRSKPLFTEKFNWPTAVTLDYRLITGAAVFGIGWGIGGFCPGPALTSALLAASGTLAFLPAMLVGMWLARQVLSWLLRAGY